MTPRLLMLALLTQIQVYNGNTRVGVARDVIRCGDGLTCSIPPSGELKLQTDGGGGGGTVVAGYCPMVMHRWWGHFGVRLDGGTGVGEPQATDPSGGVFNTFYAQDTGGAKVSDGGTSRAKFILVLSQ